VLVRGAIPEVRAAATGHAERTPPGFRAPSGALEDSFYLASGRQLWDASFIRCPTLVVASERDFWSRPQDRERLRAHLVRARRAQVVVLAGATHFVHLDRAERGREAFLSAALAFLSDGP
jgi:pimeloyl-ACP methyl ester carboxylesterase